MNPALAPQKQSLAQKLGRAGVANGFSLLADAEWQVKSGRQSPEQTLENLVVKIASLFRERP